MKADLDDLNVFVDPDDDDLPMETHDRFKVTVTFLVKADSEDDAIIDVKTVIDEGIVVLSDNELREPIHTYDVIESEPSEVD